MWCSVFLQRLPDFSHWPRVALLPYRSSFSAYCHICDRKVSIPFVGPTVCSGVVWLIGRAPRNVCANFPPLSSARPFLTPPYPHPILEFSPPCSEPLERRSSNLPVSLHITLAPSAPFLITIFEMTDHSLKSHSFRC